ncbi:MAG: hypothetical protein ACTHMG_12990 [Sphingomonas sp.]
MFAKADAAAYDAKRLGGDQIRFSTAAAPAPLAIPLAASTFAAGMGNISAA